MTRDEGLTAAGMLILLAALLLGCVGGWMLAMVGH